jgi:hypothetical protein
MAEIEHSLDDESEVKLGEDFPSGQYLKFEGSGSSIKVFLEPEHLQNISDLLAVWGYKPEKVI